MVKHITSVLTLALICVIAPLNASAELVFAKNPALQQKQDLDWSALEDATALLIPLLNGTIRDYPTVTVSLQDCGQANAFYMRDEQNTPHIVLCTELFNSISGQLRQKYDNPNELGFVFVSQLLFILTHELGHALIDVLKLPTTGREEDAVDQLGAILLESAPYMTVLAASYWSTGFSASHDVSQFAGPHGLNEQRFFNMLCWAYGADPMVRHEIAPYLPPNRQQQCSRETDQMTRAWKQLLGAKLDSAVGTLKNRRSPSGTWRFVEHFVSEDAKNRCTASGTLFLIEGLSGTFEQQGTCVTDGIGPRDNNGTSAVKYIKSDDAEFTFETSNDNVTCTYVARYEDPSRLSVRGKVNCNGFKGAFFAVR